MGKIECKTCGHHEHEHHHEHENHHEHNTKEQLRLIIITTVLLVAAVMTVSGRASSARLRASATNAPMTRARQSKSAASVDALDAPWFPGQAPAAALAPRRRPLRQLRPQPQRREHPALSCGTAYA